jgi:hypothetical protein
MLEGWEFVLTSIAVGDDSVGVRSHWKWLPQEEARRRGVDGVYQRLPLLPVLLLGHPEYSIHHLLHISKSSTECIYVFRTAAVWVRARVRSCGICGGQSGMGQVFSEYFGFPCQLESHRLLHIHHNLSSGAGTIRQLVADVPSGLSLQPHEKKKRPDLRHGLCSGLFQLRHLTLVVLISMNSDGTSRFSPSRSTEHPRPSIISHGGSVPVCKHIWIERLIITSVLPSGVGVTSTPGSKSSPHRP